VGRSNHLRDLDQNGMWADMVDVITYEIGLFGDCRLRGVGNFALSHWLEVSPLQHYRQSRKHCNDRRNLPDSVWKRDTVYQKYRVRCDWS